MDKMVDYLRKKLDGISSTLDLLKTRDKHNSYLISNLQTEIKSIKERISKLEGG